MSQLLGILIYTHCDTRPAHPSEAEALAAPVTNGSLSLWSSRFCVKCGPVRPLSIAAASGQYHCPRKRAQRKVPIYVTCPVRVLIPDSCPHPLHIHSARLANPPRSFATGASPLGSSHFGSMLGVGVLKVRGRIAKRRAGNKKKKKKSR